MFTAVKNGPVSTTALRIAGAITLSFVSLFIAVSPALSATPPAADGPSITIRYADLNLDRSDGVKRLHKRLQIAAEHVCGDPVSLGRRFVSDAWKVCVGNALDSAITKVDSPALTAYHLGLARKDANIRTASAR